MWEDLRDRSANILVNIFLKLNHKTSRVLDCRHPGVLYLTRQDVSTKRRESRDHMRQIRFIHSAQFMTCENFYIYNTAFWLFHPRGTIKCILVRCQFHNYACALAETLLSRIRAIIQVMFCSIREVLYDICAIYDIYASTFAERTKWFIISCRPIEFYLFISISLFIFPFIYLFLTHSCILWYINIPFVVYIQEEKILKEQSATECVVPKTEQTS